METETIKENIRSKLLAIAKKEITNDNVNILGKPYYLEPRDLVYLFMDIQAEYNIKLQEQELRDQQFTTVESIAALIKKHL